MGDQVCVSKVSDGLRFARYYPCGKPAKGEIDGKPACGRHLAAERKRQERNAQSTAAAHAKESTKTRLAALVSQLGTGSVGYSQSHYMLPDGTYGTYDHIRINETEALALIERLKQ